jgi:bifunctional non-homologous end joining protein LigD
MQNPRRDGRGLSRPLAPGAKKKTPAQRPGQVRPACALHPAVTRALPCGIHVREGRCGFTRSITGADWSKRYPLIVEAAAKIDGSAILDAEVVCLDLNGVAQFDARHSRVNDGLATALAFDLLMQNGEDLRRKPFAARKAILRKVLQRTRRGIQYIEHSEGGGVEMFKAVCKLGLEGIVSKKLDSPYKSGPSKAWLKIKNPNAPAATRAIDGTF